MLSIQLIVWIYICLKCLALSLSITDWLFAICHTLSNAVTLSPTVTHCHLLSHSVIRRTHVYVHHVVQRALTARSPLPPRLLPLAHTNIANDTCATHTQQWTNICLTTLTSLSKPSISCFIMGRRLGKNSVSIWDVSQCCIYSYISGYILYIRIYI